MSDKTFFYFLTIQGPDDFSAEYEIPIGITTIGRDADNLLRLNDRSVSRHHARLDCIAGECELTDLESSNGAFINGAKILSGRPVRLRDEDHIKIGPHFEMVFTQAEILSEESFPMEAEELSMALEVFPASTNEISNVTPLPPASAHAPIPFPNGISDDVPLGLSTQSHRLLQYLPGIYHTDLMARFLGIFESILFPIEWNIDNFDLFLSPRTAPGSFLPWLANWFEAGFDATWREDQRRKFLQEAHLIYARRGTKWALSRVLELYTGYPPEIDDLAEDLKPHLFRVVFPVFEQEMNRSSIEALINAHKPAHTDYELYFQA